MTPQLARTALALFLGLSLPAAAEQCPLPGQKPMLTAKLYFGESIKGRKPLTDPQWRSFLAQTVTPLFPFGFTVYDAAGQWQGEDAKHIAKENTKVIEIAAEDTPALRNNLDAIAQAYRKQFRQDSVGIVTTAACARF